MAARGLKILLIVALSVSTLMMSPSVSYAQGAGAESSAELTGTRKQLATIIFAGLAGAILGLSTLSFYGRPQEHLSNIAIGFAVGVIGGATFTTYKAATVPYDAYDVDAYNQLPQADRIYQLAQSSMDAGLSEKESAPFMAPKLSWEYRF